MGHINSKDPPAAIRRVNERCRSQNTFFYNNADDTSAAADIQHRERVAADRQPAYPNYRRRRQVEALCRLGPRPVYELLTELSRHCVIGGTVDRLLDQYAELDRAALYVAGGDRFPRRPLYLVRSDG